MRVSGVQIERFLGFRNVDIDFQPDLQVVAGANNAGKSSLVRLLEVFFQNPSGEDLQKFQPRNVYYQEEGPRALSYLTVWFDNLTAEEVQRFGQYTRQDGRLWVSLRCSRGGAVTYKASKDASADQAEQLYRDIISTYQFVKIPSIRVTGDAEGRSDSLDRLMETLESALIRRGDRRSTALQQSFMQAMDPGRAIVEEVLAKSAEAIVAELPFEDSRVSFELPDARAALRGMLNGTVILSDGAVNVPIADRGTGFQSALVLGILRYIAREQASGSSNTFFAVEEPEAFLHPQTQRAMAKVLRSIAQDAQLLVTTHSAVLVDSLSIAQVLRLPLTAGGMEFKWRVPSLQAQDEGRLSRYCSAPNSELVFASAAIFVEGEGDKALVDRILSDLCESPGGHYALGISVIEAGGLGKIKYLLELANYFGVRAHVLSDRDGLHKRDGHRVLLDVLTEGKVKPSREHQDALRNVSDTASSSLKEALQRQTQLNALLQNFNAFILSGDLEGLFLDALGVDGMLEVVGPTGEQWLDEQFAGQLSADASERYEQVAKKIGAKGWNSVRSTTGKLPPHLVGPLYDRCTSNSTVLEPLNKWLAAIVAGARPAAL